LEQSIHVRHRRVRPQDHGPGVRHRHGHRGAAAAGAGTGGIMGPPRMAAQALPGFEGPGIGDVPVDLVAGTRSVCTGPWATGHRNGPKPGIMQTKRRKPPRYKGGTKIRPYHTV